MVSHQAESKLVHRSVNACLCPLYAVEGMHVVTVEGETGSDKSVAHNVTYRLQLCTAVFPPHVCRSWESQSWVTSSPGTPGKSTRIPVWLLHSWICHVHVLTVEIKDRGSNRNRD